LLKVSRKGKQMTLIDVAKNQVVKISGLPLDEILSAQLLEQGFTLRTEIALAHKAPFNGPIAFRLHNTKISIQRSIAEQIQVASI
jgi:ferrous iron transport protein A